ncbi:MAG TPA: hypothetical protein VIJ61_13355, partial [Thermoanaerobaculia bacterium]
YPPGAWTTRPALGSRKSVGFTNVVLLELCKKTPLFLQSSGRFERGLAKLRGFLKKRPDFLQSSGRFERGLAELREL